jgi:hypothetical protein
LAPRSRCAMCGTGLRFVRFGSAFDHLNGSAPGSLVRHNSISAHTSGARHAVKMRGATAGPDCGVSQRGAIGLARQSTIVSSTWWWGPPPLHSPQTSTSHKQDDQFAKTKPCAESRLRILDQGLGLTRARSASEWPLEPPWHYARLLKGGLDPRRSRLCDSLSLDTRISRWRTALDHALVESDFLPRAQRIGP